MKERVEIIKGDITTVQVDVIVNAANSSLMGGGGVDGAIHRAGGESILAECKQIINEYGRCETGNAVITNAGLLPAKYVIHTVGPIWHGGVNNEITLLGNCYRNSLLLAKKYNCESIAFPNISTGVYHFPKKSAARISCREINRFVEKYNTPLNIKLVCFDEENYEIVKKTFDYETF